MSIYLTVVNWKSVCWLRRARTDPCCDCKHFLTKVL